MRPLKLVRDPTAISQQLERLGLWEPITLTKARTKTLSVPRWRREPKIHRRATFTLLNSPFELRMSPLSLKPSPLAADAAKKANSYQLL
jgi:hypothetical protein